MPLNEVDLHCHTTASDGGLTPRELVGRASRLALKIIAITDHDSTEGIEEALAAGREQGLEIVPGVEINTDVPSNEIHVLGYYIDYTKGVLIAELARLREGRLGRARRMVEVLNSLGVPVSLRRVLEIGRRRSDRTSACSSGAG